MTYLAFLPWVSVAVTILTTPKGDSTIRCQNGERRVGEEGESESQETLSKT